MNRLLYTIVNNGINLLQIIILMLGIFTAGIVEKGAGIGPLILKGRGQVQVL